MYSFSSTGSRESMRCPSRVVPSARTERTWVSPRWNRPEPWVCGEHADLGGQRADVGRAAPVDADAGLGDDLADGLLLDRAEGVARLLAQVLEVGVLVLLGEEGLDGLVLDGLQLLVLGLLAAGRVAVDVADLVAGQRVDAVEGGGLVVEEELELADLAGTDLVDERLLGLAQVLEDRLDRLDGLADQLLGRLGRAHVDLDDGVVGGLGLDHEDGDLAVVLDDDRR